MRQKPHSLSQPWDQPSSPTTTIPSPCSPDGVQAELPNLSKKSPSFHLFIYFYACAFCPSQMQMETEDQGVEEAGTGQDGGVQHPIFMGFQLLGCPKRGDQLFQAIPKDISSLFSPAHHPQPPSILPPHPRPFAAARRSLPRAGSSTPSQRHQSLSWNACGSAGLREIRSQGSLKRYCDGYRPGKSRGS